MVTINRLRPTPSIDTVLTDEMLARFDTRAPQYDRENRFFDEDFEELLQSGYLDIALPSEYGGLGLSVAEVAQLQRRLAYVAPATAIAINMHIYWTGVAADVHRLGDHSLDWLLEEAASGHIFAAGHGESGNDVPLFLSTTKAERVDGGWEFTGHKIFGSLSPVWTFLGLHGMDVSDPEHPQVVHAFLPRDTTGVTVKETWDTLGMRATQSHDTLLDRAFVPDRYIAYAGPPGFGGAGFFHLALNAWALFNFAAVYQGIAQRAFDLAVESAQQKTSIALTRPMAYHPEVQHGIAEMRMALESIDAQVKQATEDWANGVDYGHDWAVKILATKHTATNLAWQVVDTALELSGGAGIFKRNRMEQLFRDARLGRFHPGNTLLTHEVVGKLSLGISPDEQPRWG
jgi:alkylation response protein AidB-like acyl-CoA dehydrogenase